MTPGRRPTPSRALKTISKTARQLAKGTVRGPSSTRLEQALERENAALWDVEDDSFESIFRNVQSTVPHYVKGLWPLMEELSISDEDK
jgi:hypothetical protein